MLGSDYRELIVPRLSGKAKALAILLGGSLLTLALIAYSVLGRRFILLLPALALGFATWYFFTNEQVEYEYIISGDQLEVTKIIAQSRRKPMLTVSILTFTAMARLTEAEPQGNGQTVVLACSSQDADCFCSDFDHPELGQTRLYWTPNDDILDYLAKHLPRNTALRR